ncbi:uncharacterized protein LOC135350489 isoform X1 [Halichondria panicea]|uniref:uncharacterized protein LOC135350489 isoform X1 n=1 Tax=Halichondria panicea TaxID=6063 RepID=UPI00312B6ABF
MLTPKGMQGLTCNNNVGCNVVCIIIHTSVSSSGEVTALHRNSPVSETTLREIAVYIWMEEGCTMKDVVARLRPKTVPPGYSTTEWKEGKEELLDDKMRSILAQFEYSKRIKEYVGQGIPFNCHLIVPEVHKHIGHVICHREDGAHLLKRMATCLRQGKVKGVRLERFLEALYDPSTRLTYPAITGVRKQSVIDAERLFGKDVLEFMERKNYEAEAKYIRVIRNWRRAIDERGLTEETRQTYLQDVKDFINEDLIPWFSATDPTADYSTIEINRRIDRIKGFTRETLIGLTANIETRQWRYLFNLAQKIAPEHPRSSSSDDVECFFSILRNCVGENVTMKQVYYGWRKVCIEFTKRMDPDLLFYYFTSNSRYYEEELPSFNAPIVKAKEPLRAPRREQLALSNGCRIATLPVRNSLSVRATFHNIAINLPPLPNQCTPSQISNEHSYGQQE